MKKPVVVLFFSVVLALFGKAQSFDWAIQPGGYNFYTSVEGSSAFDGSYVVLADSWGNVYNAGVYSPASVGPTTDFDPGPAYVFPGVPGTNSFIQKFDSAGNMLWLKSFPGFEVFVYDADFDAAGNIVLVGNYNGNMDADPGASTYSLTSAGGLGTFILKIDTAGNLLWATQFETSTFLHSRPYDVEVNAINQVIFAGSFNDTLDVDPGAGVVSLIPNGTGTYVVALDASGNYVWSRQFGGSSSYASVTPSGLDTDPAGNIYLCGDYSKTIDVDPGPGVYTIGVTDTVGNSFVLKLDNTGNLVWADEFLGTGNSFFARLKIDMAGDILVTGGTEGGMDFDPGAGTVTYPALGSMFYDAFFFKLSPSGSLVWSKYFGSSSDDYGSDIEIDAANNYYVSGAYSSSADLDPGPMVNTFTSLGTDLFLQKYNATGNVEWVYALEHTTNGNVSGNAIGATTTNVYLAGFFTRYSSGGTIDFDPDTSTANLTTINVGHGFFTRLQQGPCSALKLFIDSLEQAYCDTDGYVLGHASFGVMPYTYAWSTTPVTPGPAASISASGFYTLSVTDSIGCTVNKTVFVSGPEPGGLDFDVSTIHSSVFALVMPNYFWLDLQNPGCDTASGQLYLIHDAKISVSTCTPVPDTVYGDTLVWNISSFNSDDGSFAPYIVFDVTASAIVGDYTVIKTGINTTGADIDLTNNMEKDSIEILLSYDPNEKSGEPFGECSQHYVLNSQRMQYTVQFQNTGTAAALDVYILDTLDAALDINTFKCIHASHSMITEQLPGNVLKFVFNDIYLPDSTSDEAGSHGHVVYEVDPFPSLPNNTVINNTAHIFFDFNPAVVTNTVSNTLVDTIPHYSTTQNINLTCGSTYTFPDGTLMNDIIANISHISHLSSVVSCDSIITTTVSVDPIDLTVTQSIFTLTAAATATAYQWIDCNAGNAPITGETNQSFIATSDGDYAVVITNGSCSDTSACYNITGTGIGNPAQNNFISIYPNPATNSITISTKEVAEKIMVLDVYGRVLKTLTPLQHNTTLSISELENAVYVVNVSGSNFSHSTRFVKQ